MLNSASIASNMSRKSCLWFSNVSARDENANHSPYLGYDFSLVMPILLPLIEIVEWKIVTLGTKFVQLKIVKEGKRQRALVINVSFVDK